MTTSAAPTNFILYEGPGARALTADERLAVLAPLLTAGHRVARRRELPTDGAGTVLARWTEAGTPDLPAGWELKPLPADSPASPPTAATAPPDQHWLPWFPVIDYDRCTNCMQCLSFCLFGVYGVDEEQRIQVATAESCKTNCPACSRVCPEAAIMFPKYKAGPINGAPVQETDLQREKMKVDISALLGGDVYSLLRDRSERAKSRFSQERDSDKALKERLRCLKKLQESVEIPPEVLMSLPGPEEIQRRAREAAERAAAARGETSPAERDATADN